ncbi:hypothetical protein Vadar_029093 [Vaccinium darrowii]|nr:hypothetical protein Vadar_029093 [Vaccinium darrowii]
MDSQIARQDGHDYDQNNPSGMEGQEDNQQGKTSVLLKKAKAKARKIKDKLKKKDGNGDQDNNQNYEGHQEEEEYHDDDDGDDEMVEDSEVYDSVPMYESPAVMNPAAGQNPSGNLEKPTVAAEDRHDSKYPDPQTRPFSQWQDEDTGKYGGSTGRSTAMGVADVHMPAKQDGSFSSSGTFGTPGSESAANFVPGEGAGHTGQRPKISMETPTGMEEDPHSPKDRPDVASYQSKVTDPTGAGGEEAGITGILHSFNKVNVSDEPESNPRSEEAPALYTGSHDQFSPEPIPPQSTMNPVDPGSDLRSFDSNTTEDVPLDNVTNLPSNQSGYTEKLSYATSAIADKAIAAKNVVASKLGYGGNQDQTAASESTQGVDQEIGKPGMTAEYGQKIVATVTEKLAPVYEKVSSVGAPMYEKVSNAGSSVVTPVYEKVSSVGAPVYEKVSNAGSSMVSKVRGTGTGQEGGVEGQDQGVSVKEYLAEKLRPGEEDKALSEMISETLYTQKQGGEGDEGENQKPVGIVTESEEVRERLGSDDDPNREMTETESKIAGNASATGKGMVESVKGTVTSWFSRGGDQKQASEAGSPGNTHGEEATTGYENGLGERRLQESGN